MAALVRRAAATLVALALGTALAAPVLGAITLPPKSSTSSVYDLANIWKPGTEQTAQAIIDSIQRATSVEVVAVSTESASTAVTTEEAQADAQSIMDTWAIGSAAVHDGLVVLFDMNHGSTEHGQVYVLAGDGFFPSLTQGKSVSQIVNEDMLPVVRSGDLDSALLVGLADIATTAQPSAAGTPDSSVLPAAQPGVNVYDFADIWTTDTRASAQTIANGIKARTEAEVAIVSWQSDDYDVSTDTAKADALAIMNAWGVGRAGVNDGLVVLFDMDHGSTSHGQIYLYAGSGYLASYLDESEAADIVNNTMLPAAKDGDLNKALLDGLAKVDHATQPGGNPDRGTRDMIRALMVVLVLGAGVLVLALFLRTWWVRGRDARVVPIDDSVLLPSPPPGLTPALATVLQDDGVNRDSFTSALVDLGHRGLVTFQQASGFAGIGSHVDMVVPPEPLIDPSSLEARRRPLGAAEAALAMSISSKSVGGVLSWDRLKQGEGAKLYASFKSNIGKAAQQSGFFRDDPNAITSRWMGFGLALVIGIIVFAVIFVVDKSDSGDFFQPGMAFMGLPLLVSILMGVGVMVFAGRLAARTESGAQALGMALAYRNTLRYEIQQAKTVDQAVAQTRTKLPWITTPDLLTVWAVAFGLKDDIDKLIKETMETTTSAGSAVWAPMWYSGSGGIGSMSSLASSIGSISTSATSSSGSGFGGGGGGGGGGAGGGF